MRTIKFILLGFIIFLCYGYFEADREKSSHVEKCIQVVNIKGVPLQGVHIRYTVSTLTIDSVGAHLSESAMIDGGMTNIDGTICIREKFYRDENEDTLMIFQDSLDIRVDMFKKDYQFVSFDFNSIPSLIVLEKEDNRADSTPFKRIPQ